MKGFRKSILIIIVLLFVSLGNLFGVEPIKKVLTQQKLDQFIVDLDKITSTGKIKNAWDSYFQQASFDALMSGDAALYNPLIGSMMIMINTRSKIKEDVAVTNELKKYGWTNEFWDIYIVTMVSMHYKTVTDGNAELAKLTNTPSGFGELPDIKTFINENDYELFCQNYSKICKLIEEEINKANGY